MLRCKTLLNNKIDVVCCVILALVFSLNLLWSLNLDVIASNFSGRSQNDLSLHNYWDTFLSQLSNTEPDQKNIDTLFKNEQIQSWCVFNSITPNLSVSLESDGIRYYTFPISLKAALLTKLNFIFLSICLGGIVYSNYMKFSFVNFKTKGLPNLFFAAINISVIYFFYSKFSFTPTNNHPITFIAEPDTFLNPNAILTLFQTIALILILFIYPYSALFSNQRRITLLLVLSFVFSVILMPIWYLVNGTFC